MFWKVGSLSNGSAIEAILDKQHITLEELLEEDELVQVGSAKLLIIQQCMLMLHPHCQWYVSAI